MNSNNTAQEYAKSMFKEIDLLLDLSKNLKRRRLWITSSKECQHVEFIVDQALKWCEIVIELCLLIDKKSTDQSTIQKTQRCAHRMSIITRETHEYFHKIDVHTSHSLRLALSSTQRASSYTRELVRALSYSQDSATPSIDDTIIYLDCIHCSVFDARQHVLASDIGLEIQKYLH